MRTAKMLASGDLQLIILLLLSEKPRHGYEIIKAVEEHSSGVYTPSPGMVYPALTYLEEMGYAAAAVEGTKKLYSMSADGTEHLSKHHVAANEVWNQLAIFGRKLAHFRKQFAEDEDVADHFGSGSSAGANMFAALRVAKKLGKGKRVVTIAPDSAERYMSKKIFEGGI